MIQNSYGVIANLLLYDLILYAVTVIAPDMAPLYDQFYQSCERAVSIGNTIQIFTIVGTIAVGIIVILQAVSKLSWLSLLILRNILADAAKMVSAEVDVVGPISYIAGIVTMANIGFRTFGAFIYSNWLLLASIGVFIRILPFDLGKRVGTGLLGFAVLNYLLIPFYPIFRDIFTFFLRETYPFAAYFPMNYVVLDGVFLGLYVGFILWLVGGVSRMTFGVGDLIPALGATQIISMTRDMIGKGMAAVQQVAETVAETLQQDAGARSLLLQSIGATRGEILSLPAGDEGLRQTLLGRLDELETWVKGISLRELMDNRDATAVKLESELHDIRNTVDTLFYEKGELPRELPETPTPRVLDTGGMVDRYERETIQPRVDTVLGPHPHVVAATVGDIQIFAREGDWNSIEGAKGVADYIGDVIPEGHRGYINRVFINTGYHYFDEKGQPTRGEAYPRPDGKTDIFLYHGGVTPYTTFHEVGHAVEDSFTGREWAEWDAVHESLKHNYSPDFYMYKQPKETFAESYTKWASNEPLPDNVKSFFDRHIANREHREVK